MAQPAGIYIRPKNSVKVDHLRAEVSTPDLRNTKHSVGTILSLMETLVWSVWRWRLLGTDKSSSGNYFPKFCRNQVRTTSKLREILAQQHTASYSRRIKSSTNERCEKFNISKYIIFFVVLRLCCMGVLIRVPRTAQYNYFTALCSLWYK